jgi:serine phosphatase RsbU (regulator of sigma subunit)/tetratricopeptide (TPR) repeat protein
MSLQTHLNTLESAGLVRLAQLEPDLEYLFRHALVQEAAYASILAGDRQRLHEAVGRAVERLYPNRLDELAAFLANHFERSGELARARYYFRRAGERALASYANQEAELHFRKALEFNTDPDEQAELLEALGKALNRQSRHEEAIYEMGEALELYRAAGKFDQAARMYASLARATWYQGDIPASLQVCLNGLEACQDSPLTPGLANLYHETGRAYYFNGQPNEADYYCRKALAAAEILGAEEVQADSLTTIGILSVTSRTEALEDLAKAIEIAERNSYLAIAHRAHHNFALTIQDITGDMALVRKHYERAIEISHIRGMLTSELLSKINLIAIEINEGKIRQAREELVEIGEKFKEISETSELRFDYRTIDAILDWLEGHTDRALNSLRIRLAHEKSSGNLQSLANLNAEICECLLELNYWGYTIDWQEAENSAQEFNKISERGITDPVYALSLLVMLYAQKGDLVLAQQYLTEMEAEAQLERRIWDQLNLGRAQAKLALARNDWETAAVCFEQLAEQNSKIGRRLEASRCLAYWADALARSPNASDLEKAAALARSAQTDFNQMEVPYVASLIEKLIQKIRYRTQLVAQESQLSAQELAAAGRLQEHFLPKAPPTFPGWQLVAHLEPARQTSGDFYDFINLPLETALVIADVADKGAGAALFMTLTRSLLRTYATEYPDQPSLVLAETNRRILGDTSEALFVTLFYALLNPERGELRYSSAGHNPPYLLRAGGGLETLPNTGIPVGVLEEAVWSERAIQLQPGDTLVLYTDGVTEAQDVQGDFFGEPRLEAVLNAHLGEPAENILQAIRRDLAEFVGAAHQTDDITLMVIQRVPDSK